MVRHLPSKKNHAGSNPAQRSKSIMTSESRKEYFRKWYQANKEKLGPAKKKAVIAYRARKSEKFYAIMAPRMKCIKCGEADRACLDFHHRNPSEKDGNVSHMLQLGSVENAMKEAEKCDILCSNCHRKLHYYS